MPARRVATLWYNDSMRLVPSGSKYKLLFDDSRGREKTQWLKPPVLVDDVLSKLDIVRADAETIVAAIGDHLVQSTQHRSLPGTLDPTGPTRSTTVLSVHVMCHRLAPV